MQNENKNASENENSINNILTEGSCQFLRVGKKSSDEKEIIKDLQNEASNEILTIHGDVNLNLPFRTDVKAEIRTTEERPIWSKQYPYPMSVNNFVNDEIQNLLQKGIIRESKSPYNSPVWVVPKKGTNDDGSPKLRLVIDFKKINEKTISDRYPMPNPEIILTNFGKSKYFSTIDLESGFYQILMKESDIEKTAFSVNNGKYEFLRMPFGLKNAPSIFQRAMDNVLRKYIGKFCHVYVDDVIIFSKSLEEHKRHLSLVIEILRGANMKISSEKSKFYQEEVEFLGYVVANNIIKTDPKKVEAIQNYPIPGTLRQLRGFLGLTGYYRKFIENYAVVSKPLTVYLQGENGRISQHLSKKKMINLDQEGIAACERLNNLLSQQMQ